MRRIMVALCLLVLSSTQALGRKHYNVQADLLRWGYGPAHWTLGSFNRTDMWSNVRLAGLTFSYRGVRLGVSLLDNPPPGNSILPIEVGYTIYQRPLRYGWFQGMVPDVFAEAGYYWANGIIDDNMYGPTWKVGARAEIDYFGLGAGAEVAYFWTFEPHTDVGPKHGPAASLYVRLLVTNFGF